MSFAECSAASLPPTAYLPFVISLVVPTPNVPNHCSMFHGDQHCPSHSKITAARGVPALSNDRKTNIFHSPQTLALYMGMELRTAGQVTLFPLGGLFWLTKVPHPWPCNSV